MIFTLPLLIVITVIVADIIDTYDKTILQIVCSFYLETLTTHKIVHYFYFQLYSEWGWGGLCNYLHQTF